MNIQFHHKRTVIKAYFDYLDKLGIITKIEAKGGTTLALEVPTVEEFDNFKITDPNKDDYSISTIELKFGSAKCSNKDNYNKKLGRNIAKGRMQTVVFFAKKHTENEVVLVAAQGSFPKLVLRKSPKGNRVYFIGGN